MPSQQIYDADDGSELLMVLLMPEAISKTWPDLKAAIETALPPLSNPTQTMNRMTDILESLLSGRLFCHTLYKMIDNSPYVFGIVVSAFLHNVENDQKNLLIYSLYGHPKYITGDYAEKFINKMKEFARGHGCKALVAYSNVLSPRSDSFRQRKRVSFALVSKSYPLADYSNES